VRARQERVIAFASAAGAVTVAAMNFAFAPRLGALGSALASACGFGVAKVVTLLAYRRHGLPMIDRRQAIALAANVGFVVALLLLPPVARIAVAIVAAIVSVGLTAGLLKRTELFASS